MAISPIDDPMTPLTLKQRIRLRLRGLGAAIFNRFRNEDELTIEDLKIDAEQHADHLATLRRLYRAQDADLVSALEALERMEDELAALKKRPAAKKRAVKKKAP